MTTVLTWIAQSGVVQGVIIGATLAFLTAIVVMNGVIRSLTTTVNGWSSIRRAGQPDNGILVRAATAKALPVVNVFDEAAYWASAKDSAGQRLNGRNAYTLTFPAGQLPPNGAFWSLTSTDTVGYMMNGSAGRSSIDDRSKLDENADGSIEIYLQREAPAGREGNWLSIPGGTFKLMLRAYLPGAAILDGSYRVPPVVRAL